MVRCLRHRTTRRALHGRRHPWDDCAPTGQDQGTQSGARAPPLVANYSIALCEFGIRTDEYGSFGFKHLPAVRLGHGGRDEDVQRLQGISNHRALDDLDVRIWNYFLNYFVHRWPKSRASVRVSA